MDLPLPKPDAKKKPPVAKGLRELRANLKKYINLADKNKRVIVEVYGNDRRLKARYELKRLKLTDKVDDA